MPCVSHCRNRHTQTHRHHIRHTIQTHPREAPWKAKVELSDDPGPFLAGVRMACRTFWAITCLGTTATLGLRVIPATSGAARLTARERPMIAYHPCARGPSLASLRGAGDRVAGIRTAADGPGVKGQGITRRSFWSRAVAVGGFAAATAIFSGPKISDAAYGPAGGAVTSEPPRRLITVEELETLSMDKLRQVRDAFAGTCMLVRHATTGPLTQFPFADLCVRGQL